jgi:hypothetical protein
VIRLAFAAALVILLTVSSSSSSQPDPVSTVGRPAVEPDGAAGRSPVDVPKGTAAAAEQGEPVTPDSLDYTREIAKQGTLGLLCLAVLWSYRRDFFRKLEDKDREIAERKEERDKLEEVLGHSTTAITNSAVATARQTDATHRLARTVENLERRQAGLPPSASSV